MKRIHTALTREEIEQLLKENQDHQCEGIGKDQVCVRILSVANLPSLYGDFQVVAFCNSNDDKEHAALIHGDILDQEGVPVRIHSECLTGDVLGSLRCDCHDQLVTALRTIGKMRHGILLYLRQEGRGIGFANKIRAYALQEEGLDTTEANLALGFRDDEREYSVAAHMMRSLRVKSIRLMTNNPHKISEIEKCGVNVVERIPLIIPPNRHNRFYLETKEKKFGHLLDGISDTPQEHFQEQMDVAVFRKR
ncbi:MAG: GTP cyclohydrolase II [Nitrospirae bacterium]|nr:GTP cyclohydrolase II [Nitrospirota bacterium]